jgi:acyl-CoA reductase-like NAD-dependent aldehyde dehydrogenase
MTEIVVDNPATGDEAARVPSLDADALIAASRAARRASRDFESSTIEERIRLCERVLDEFDARGAAVASDLTRQMGKPVGEARAELRTMASRARHMMEIAQQTLEMETAANKNGYELTIERVPVGVVLDIAAWNYPLLIAVNIVVPAVLAGNAVVLKHSSRTPLCAAHFADAFVAAGAPADLVVAAAADHHATAQLIGRGDVDYVAFTGSVEGGRAVSNAAAGRFLDVGLELGGKDPAYVRADVDIESTATSLAEGAFYNAGQSCCGVERIYVARSRYAEFLDALVAATAAWTPGDPTREDTTLGPMAQPDAPNAVSAQLSDATAKGARVLCGGGAVRVGGAGRYFEATVVADADHRMAVMTQETFGPVVAVAAVEDDDEALRMMNDSRYGLTASIWSTDVSTARKMAAYIEAGTVFLNRCDYLDPALPWSGWKDSGVGITLSRLGFDRLVKTRARHFRLPTS